MFLRISSSSVEFLKLWNLVLSRIWHRSYFFGIGGKNSPGVVDGDVVSFLIMASISERVKKMIAFFMPDGCFVTSGEHTRIVWLLISWRICHWASCSAVM